MIYDWIRFSYCKPKKSHLFFRWDFPVVCCSLRQAQAVKNKYIPLILGGISMVLCAVWVMATSEIETAKEGAMAVFTAVTQGILVAGLSNYVNQIIKQIHKPE